MRTRQIKIQKHNDRVALVSGKPVIHVRHYLIHMELVIGIVYGQSEAGTSSPFCYVLLSDWVAFLLPPECLAYVHTLSLRTSTQTNITNCSNLQYSWTFVGSGGILNPPLSIDPKIAAIAPLRSVRQVCSSPFYEFTLLVFAQSSEDSSPIQSDS